jgi:hypothetical protein
MTAALEPCLFEYYYFLVKEQGDFNTSAINEITALWRRLADLYGLEVRSDSIFQRIKDLSSEIYLDKSVKILETLHTPDNSIWLRQSLAHDVLILTVLINSPEGTETKTPHVMWYDYYEKVSGIRQQLQNLYYHGTVLQTIISGDNEEDRSFEADRIAKYLQTDFEPFKSKKVSIVELPEGKLWQYGNNHRFLFTLSKENEQDASIFLANDFPYIISLLGKIENHYILAVKLYESLNRMERSAKELEGEDPAELEDSNLEILDAKKDEIGQIDKKAIETVSSMRICGNNIEANMKNLRSALPKIPKDDENFINNLFEKYDEYIENIKSWSEVSDNVLMRITKYVTDTKSKLSEKLSQRRLKEGLEPVSESKPLYSTQQEDPDFDLDSQHYPPQTKQSVYSHLEQMPAKGEECIEWGSNYIFFEDDPYNSFLLFKECSLANFNSMCITRQHPDKIKSKFELEKDNIAIYWLSTTSCDYCLPPLLTRISHEISKFVKDNGNRIIMLDGLEFLVSHNDFLQVLKFIDKIKEIVMLKQSILLITISPEAFEPKELSLIRKNTGMINISASDLDLRKLV